MTGQTSWIRKQTLTNAERYITEDLKNLENQILGAEEKVIALEYEAFTYIREEIAKNIKRLQKSANIVSTLDVLTSFAEVAEDGAEIWGNLAAAMTPIAAYGFLVFNLLCAPCFAAMGAIKREMNNTKWFFFAIGYQCGLAYLVSLCIYQIGTLLTGGGFGIWTVVTFAIIVAFLYLLFRPYKESESLNVNVKGMAKAR